MDCANSSAHQQFCLRWHNHQASLLSTLPLLLDQSHLTDVTLSAEGKTLQAHRFVLSACSSFFSELFRTLDSSLHPVIVIPGSTFNTLVALLSFMYTGEVNVYEEQIPTLLSIAETLGIKGLADFQNNLQNSSKISENNENSFIRKTKSPTIPSSTIKNSSSSSLENFFIKSFHLNSNLMPQPLNFSQSALNKTSEILAKYQQHCNYQQNIKDIDDNHHLIDENSDKEQLLTDSNKSIKDIRKIDKIAENLRCGNTTKNFIEQNPKNLNDKCRSLSSSSSSFVNTKLTSSSASSIISLPSTYLAGSGENSSKCCEKLPISSTYNNPSRIILPENVTGTNTILEKTINSQTKTSNSKLYATCFICHKQLSNQYNLRVHLETHQNVRYACSVCSHVSRSKDALRKHVSYRHPGAPSPCESDTRRKRSKALGTGQTPYEIIKPELTDRQMSVSPNLTNQSSFIFMQNQFQTTGQCPKLTNVLLPETTNLSNDEHDPDGSIDQLKI